MTRVEMVAEIERVQAALEKTTSRKLTRDYNKHLKRMRRELADYDRFMGRNENTTQH